jgi:phage replication-related protein YjqB (UPF0714/DUF867 family)
MDKYKNFRRLRREEQEGIDYRTHLSQGTSGIAVIAPHGGGIEPGTMELAKEIAESIHTFYCFEGIKKTRNADLHITSENFDESHGLSAVKRSKTVLAIHGCDGDEEAVYLGGLDNDLKETIKKFLIQAGFRVEKSPRPALQGKSQRNICNRCGTGGGVQLEISKGLRKRMFANLTRQGRKHKTETFCRFVSASRKALSGT